jgi:RIO kinase 1
MPSMDSMMMDQPFEPTYTGGRREREWLLESLSEFYEDGLLADVLYKVKGGKEATVYCCRARPETGLDLLAAKVFRPRMFRAMRNDSLYKMGRGMTDGEGKLILDGRSQRAIAKGTRYGKALGSAGWCRHEYDALKDLHEAHADVPRPVAVSSNAILMEYVGDEDMAAPILQSVALTESEAHTLFGRLIENVEILLSCYRIHADLSAYNVLYWEGEARIIDFPQTVDPMRHPEAFRLFSRDVDRLCGYFRKQGVEADATCISIDLWQRHIG